MLMSIDFERFFEQFLYVFFGTFPQDFLHNFCFFPDKIFNIKHSNKKPPQSW